ncbi:hypothetical protein ACIQTT_01750 [Microbacterium sp. NPDC090225]|uniref:hypothetical protein n=1 Tax=Microbacterium sp. NPDC090225 TaxID=3364207 RepID=UPI003817C94B
MKLTLSDASQALTIADWIQVLVVITAIGASIVALVIAAKDRKNAVRIAEDDRRTAIDQALLLSELEAAKRLAILEARGGHTDPVVRKDMGAETLALTALLGPERVPAMWKRRVPKSDEELRAYINDESEPQFLRDAVEAERAVYDILKDLRALRPASGTDKG